MGQNPGGSDDFSALRREEKFTAESAYLTAKKAK
jgi:hypothetical protein